MAGLGETCSHVASLLWAIEAGVRARDAVTVTGKKAYWMLSPGVKEVPYAPIQRIKFIGKKSCMSQMARQQSDTSSSSSTERSSGSAIIPAGPDRKRRFLDDLYLPSISCWKTKNNVIWSSPLLAKQSLNNGASLLFLNCVWCCYA